MPQNVWRVSNVEGRVLSESFFLCVDKSFRYQRYHGERTQIKADGKKAIYPYGIYLSVRYKYSPKLPPLELTPKHPPLNRETDRETTSSENTAGQ